MRNVLSIIMSVSYTECNVNGQMVSSFKVNVVKPSLETVLDEMLLYLAPESNKQRKFCFPLGLSI